jgi:hypothetical protein
MLPTAVSPWRDVAGALPERTLLCTSAADIWRTQPHPGEDDDESADPTSGPRPTERLLTAAAAPIVNDG